MTGTWILGDDKHLERPWRARGCLLLAGENMWPEGQRVVILIQEQTMNPWHGSVPSVGLRPPRGGKAVPYGRPRPAPTALASSGLHAKA